MNFAEYKKRKDNELAEIAGGENDSKTLSYQGFDQLTGEQIVIDSASLDEATLLSIANEILLNRQNAANCLAAADSLQELLDDCR